jgi:hypothetical protein
VELANGQGAGKILQRDVRNWRDVQIFAARNVEERRFSAALQLRNKGL